MSPWIHTFTGRRFYPLAPRSTDVCIEDIAHALALKCRWTGHAREFYSIAEHSVRVARQLGAQGYGPKVMLAGLLHDAGEAYLPDVASPIKGEIMAREEGGKIRTFNNAEGWLLFAICNGLDLRGLDVYCHGPEVRAADLILLVTEARDLMHGTGDWEWDPPRPLDGVIAPWGWQFAEAEFLGEFDALVREIAGEARDA